MMNNLIMVACILAIAYFAYSQYHTKYKISPQKAKEMMKEDVAILDVREKSEYKTSHIAKAINIPVSDIDSKIEKIVFDKDKTILVYCQAGSRSRVACRHLSKLGYRHVYNFGGITHWPYDTEK
jgi:phage shock protein E